MKSEARRPKTERRPSSEIRRTKPEAEGDSGFGLRAGGQQQRVTYRFVTSASPLKHPREHWDIQIRIVINLHFPFVRV